MENQKQEEVIMTFDEKVKLWEHWLDDCIKPSVETLIFQSYYFKQLRDVFSNNPLLEPETKRGLFQYLCLSFNNSASVGVRKQCIDGKSDTKNISIRKLLNRLKCCSDLELHILDLRMIDIDIDIKKLENATYKINRFVNTIINHFDDSGEKFEATYDESFSAIYLIDSMFRKYYFSIFKYWPLILFDYNKLDSMDIYKKPWIVED